MSCIGSSLKEVKDTVRQGVQSILNKNGGTLNTNNTVELGSTQISEVASYLNEVFGAEVGTSPWLIQRDGKVYYQFPQEVESWVNKAIELNSLIESMRNESSEQIGIEEDLMNSRTVESNLLSETRPGDLMFAPTVNRFDNEEVTAIINSGTPPVGNAPLNFKQWVDQKKALLENIITDFNNFKRGEPKNSNYYRNTVAEYERLILEMDKNIKDINNLVESPADIYADVIKEIRYLEDVISKMGTTNIDTFKLERRLDILSKMFLNKKLNGELLNQATKDSNIFFVVDGDPEVLKIRDEIRKLMDKYSEGVFESISLLLSDNTLIKEYERQGKMEFTDPATGQLYTGQAATEKIVELLKDIQGTGWTSSFFLGAAWNNTIGQLARIVGDVNLRENQAQVQERLKTVQENLAEFKRSGLTVDIFEQEDEFGAKNGFLIHKYSPAWFKHLASQREERKLFNKVSQNFKASIYDRWMTNKKNNERVLDFTKIKAIRDRFSTSPFYQNEFVADEAEMSSYESELRSILGDLFFEDMVKQQITALEDYEVYHQNNSQDFLEEVESVNPISFLKHFNSIEYNKAKDGVYLSPNYNVSFPIDKRTNFKGEEVSTGLYSENFNRIEQNEAAFKIWQSLADLYQNYINPTLREDGFNATESGLDLAKIDEYMQSTIYHNLSWNKRAIQYILNFYNRYIACFMDPAYNRKKDSSRVRVRYSDTLRKRAKDMAEILEDKELSELMDMASKERILKFNKTQSTNNILDSDGINLINSEIQTLQDKVNNANSRETAQKAKRDLQSYIKDRKRALAKSIANNKFYSYANVDILSVTSLLAEACAVAKANKKTSGTLNLLESYVRDSATNTTDAKKKRALSNLSNFLHSWNQTNLLGNINHKDLDVVQQAMNFKVFKVKSKVDKEMAEFLHKEVKNVDSKEDFQFKIDNITYEKKDGKFYQKEFNPNFLNQQTTDEAVEISKDEFEKFYASYIGEKISNLGQDVSVGALLMGSVRLKAIAALALNIPAGVTNRLVGNNINRLFAASGRFGFNEEQLQRSKNFLAMSNIDRYLYEGIGLPGGSRGREHAERIRTFKLFTTSFGLIQNKLNEIDGISDTFNKEGFSIMDWAVNFAEFHNQGEIILSILQNYTLDYIDGNGNTVKVPIFDGETGEFVYKPGTLVLKDEYRTEENIRIWENFAASKDGNNPHLTALFQSQAAIERSQGNYNDKDKTMAMGSAVGRVLLLFKRYMPEQFFNQYGKIDQDLIMGQENYEGRTRVLFKYGPATSVILGTIGLTTLGPWGALAGVGAGAVSYVVNMVKNKQIHDAEQEALTLLDQAKLSLSLFSEILMRTANRPIQSITRKAGKGGRLFDVNKRINNPDSKLAVVMDEKQRKILTESAQDASNAIYAATTAMIMLVVIRFVGEIVMGVEDDDDEETYKEKMKLIEQISNLIINRLGYLSSDFIRNFHPQVFFDDTKPAIYNTIESFKGMIESGKAYYNEEGDLAPFLLDAQRALPLPIPNSVADAFLKDGKSPIQDPKIYEEPWWLPYTKTEEQNADKAIRFQRKKVKEEMLGVYKKAFLEELKSRSEEEQAEFASNWYTRNQLIEKYANEAVNRQFNKLYRRRNGEASTDYFERINLKEEREAWKNDEYYLDFSLYDMERGLNYRDKTPEESGPKILY